MRFTRILSVGSRGSKVVVCTSDGVEHLYDAHEVVRLRGGHVKTANMVTTSDELED